MRKIAISDIHGCNDTFQRLLEKLALVSGDELYLLGDYIDRGADSKGVLDTIFLLQQQGLSVQCLKGNHEQMILDAVDGIDDELMDLWYFEVDEYILVHAGFNFKIPLPFADGDAMLWIRDWYHNLNRNWLGDRIIVHGHTPMRKDEIREQFKNLDNLPILDIDGGCVHKGKRRGVGYLCAFDMTNRELYFQDNIEN